ncbi:Hypothetical predicted protein, partial [Olea europaea subsp. europaea]
CWEEEMNALLHLKENINFPDRGRLPSWVVNEIGADWSQWQRVECSNTTKRVIQLNPDGARNLKLGDWYFNASLFLPFQELRNLSLYRNQLGFDRLLKLRNLEALDLGSNSFDRKILSSLSHEKLFRLAKLEVLGYTGNYGIIKDDILSVLNIMFQFSVDLVVQTGLKYLKVINLQFNYFNNSIFSSVHWLSSLKSLDLSYNKLKGTIQMKNLCALSDLVELDLSGNEVDNFTALTRIKRIHHLQVLKLEGIGVSIISNMVQSLRAFSYLKDFYFWYNHANGSMGSYEFLNFPCISIELLVNECKVISRFSFNGWLCELKNLQELDLSGIKYKGILPSCVANMTSLRLVDLSYNTLTYHTIHSQEISRLLYF